MHRFDLPLPRTLRAVRGYEDPFASQGIQPSMGMLSEKERHLILGRELFDPGDAICRIADVDVGMQVCPLLVLRGNCIAEFLDRLGVYQIDCTSSESSPGHSRAMHPSDVIGELDEKVEFGAAHFVVIAEAAMGFGHGSAQIIETIVLEGLGGLVDALVFRDDMPAAFIHVVWKLGTTSVELVHCGVA